MCSRRVGGDHAICSWGEPRHLLQPREPRCTPQWLPKTASGSPRPHFSLLLLHKLISKLKPFAQPLCKYKKLTVFCSRLSAISVFPINDSARVQLCIIMLILLLFSEDLNHKCLWFSSQHICLEAASNLLFVTKNLTLESKAENVTWITKTRTWQTMITKKYLNSRCHYSRYWKKCHRRRHDQHLFKQHIIVHQSFYNLKNKHVSAKRHNFIKKYWNYKGIYI